MRFLHKNIKKERKSMNEKKEFKPYIPADKVMPELTVTSVIIGVLLAILFGGANAYLGLRVGMTVSASIPAAVISMGIIRFILRRDSILENNMVQTIGSAGESVAAGAIFTLPALFMWAQEEGTAMPSLVEIALIALIGGFLGVLFMIPLRSALIVQEHGVLPYPEGQACAVGMKGMVAAISIGSVICIIAAIAGDTSQDLKTGYIVGATPYKQQAGELIGVAVSAITVGGVLYLLNAAWGYGSTELPAPQATLMKMVVEGVMGNSLPWSLVFAGVAIAIVVEILQIPVLPFAVGLYLPIYLSTPIMVGGLVRLYVDKKKGITEEERKAKVNQGILYSSGLIAGEGLVGILLAVFAIIPVGADTLGDVINISKIINLGNIGGLVFFACLVATLVAFINKKEKKTK